MTGSHRVVVDTGSDRAPWRQVRDQIVHLIATGELPVGSTLPSIRQLARDLGLAPGTVARAYRALETTGVLETARSKGTRVASSPEAAATTEPLAAAAHEFAERARDIGADLNTALAAVEDAYRASEP
ncbi:GntR family transcriptional regulator [Saccharopolyspora sp. TS4A08]|uniref:GntR family transcriptional regulator n=1 Tax=Saccharopolyspora ipomoeae TaxID=3042027 RepID=A0ABT6PR31_9PSEU|nr:GntR family transcriptional regulator [Saccharopolyspora sp. TS4A08]MDI2030469.1 GntR family transcriptional regulator [Saccharopolyspora sp. TS4A08]